MTPGIRQHKAASCRVAVPMGLPEDMRDATRELVGVQSGNPRKGHAKALLRAICSEADADWVTLLLHVEPFNDGMDIDRLKKFYAGCGFVEIQKDPCLMARSPVFHKRHRIVVPS
jgi:hypothetical protein